ncbi:hypothetical protein [Lacinutrix mariniflava]|uniref:hypothetical protein n=1 Tax=Lacinutrix mariniflava TaxID=342955 RepID=UPI0006E35305|nr:hypothetical protein [Lacinutrix mariniflava]
MEKKFIISKKLKYEVDSKSFKTFVGRRNKSESYATIGKDNTSFYIGNNRATIENLKKFYFINDSILNKE